jgi:uroporphyrinogen-III decarboxylase
MTAFCQELKAINPNLKIAYHSDGNIYPIIDELIEIGIDVLNPIQPAAMDPVYLKKRYGKNLSFWGTIDEQYTLPFGSVEDVRQETLSRIQNVAPGGGLILSPTHHIQLDTPIENFLTFLETVQSRGNYPIKTE